MRTCMCILGAIKRYDFVCISGHERADGDRWACTAAEELDVVIAVCFRLVSLKERPFTLPIRPQRALPSQGALSTVSCCLHHSSRYVSAPLRRRPPPHALPVWGCGRWPSPPFPSCFRPTRLFPSRETLCFCGCVNLTLRGRVRLARLQC